jgi:hypothetical protein
MKGNGCTAYVQKVRRASPTRNRSPMCGAGSQLNRTCAHVASRSKSPRARASWTITGGEVDGQFDLKVFLKDGSKVFKCDSCKTVSGELAFDNPMKLFVHSYNCTSEHAKKQNEMKSFKPLVRTERTEDPFGYLKRRSEQERWNRG